jgi:hypothetical protein
MEVITKGRLPPADLHGSGMSGRPELTETPSACRERCREGYGQYFQPIMHTEEAPLR